MVWNPYGDGNLPWRAWEEHYVRYREAAGWFMYLKIYDLPDIGFSVLTLEKYVEIPKSVHWNAVKRIMRYLNHYNILRIKLNSINKNTSRTEDWAHDEEEQK